jgi:hypothetical protein
MILRCTLALGLLCSTSAFADFMPKNNLHLEDKINDSSMTEERFNEIIDVAEAHYAPIVASHGATLTFNRKWSNGTVNASATQQGDDWIVNMYGGLARRDEVTDDGFALVICHELGHHLAGFPFVRSWAANEGQADYFATQSCGRDLWIGELEENAKARATATQVVQDVCNAVWQAENDQNLCYRILAASQSLADLLAGGAGQTSYETPDTTQVSSTDHSHPAAQCRLDTYGAAAVCGAAFDRDLIPGKRFANRNSADAEREASEVSCTEFYEDLWGVRPRCWFAPGI